MANDETSAVDDEKVREHARCAVRNHGLQRAAKQLGVNRQTVLALVAGTPVSKGSFAIVREHLRQELAARKPGETP